MGRPPDPNKNPTDLKLIRIFLPPIVEAQLRDYYEQTGNEVANVIRTATETYLADLKARGIYQPLPGFNDAEIMAARRELMLKTPPKKASKGKSAAEPSEPTVEQLADVGEDK